MRPSLALSVALLLLAPAAVDAQDARTSPRPNAPLAQHVAHLLTLAPGGFPSIRGPVARPRPTGDVASGYAIIFRGAYAVSLLRWVEGWNASHVTTLPVADGTETATLWAAMADSVGSAVPAGWRAARTSGVTAVWNECARGGREVMLQQADPWEKPALLLTVTQYEGPCHH